MNGMSGWELKTIEVFKMCFLLVICEKIRGPQSHNIPTTITEIKYADSFVCLLCLLYSCK